MDKNESEAGRINFDFVVCTKSSAAASENQQKDEKKKVEYQKENEFLFMWYPRPVPAVHYG